MTEPRLTITADGADIALANDQVVMDNGLDGAVMLSLFGGNQDDSGDPNDNAVQWWGNLTEPDEQRHLRSSFLAALIELEPTPRNLIQLEERALDDLAWLVENEIVESIVATVSMPGVKRAKLRIQAIVDGVEYSKTFDENWSGPS